MHLITYSYRSRFSTFLHIIKQSTSSGDHVKQDEKLNLKHASEHHHAMWQNFLNGTSDLGLSHASAATQGSAGVYNG